MTIGNPRTLMTNAPEMTAVEHMQASAARERLAHCSVRQRAAVIANHYMNMVESARLLRFLVKRENEANASDEAIELLMQQIERGHYVDFGTKIE